MKTVDAADVDDKDLNMSLIEQITADMKTAMKAKDNATLSTLRLLRSAIKNKQIDAKDELSEDDVMAVVKTSAKQLKDSITAFTDAGRDDLAEPTKVELAVLEKYLPVQMSDEELEGVVKEAVEASGASSKAEMGMVMGAAMKAVAGRADGSRVKEMVAKLLPVVALFLLASTPAHAAIDYVGSANLGSTDVMMGLRVFRVVLIWFGIFAVNLILMGGFGYMTSSMRDDGHLDASKKMTSGFVGAFIAIGLFAITTVFIETIA